MQHGSVQLQAWLDRSHLRQREAAKRLQIHYTYLNQLLKRRRLPGRDMATWLEQETGIPVAAWSTRVGQTKKHPVRRRSDRLHLQGVNV